MFRNSQVLSASYQDFRIEVRLLHVPKGILSELKLFDKGGGEPELILCQRFSFADADEAVQALAAECCGYIDRWKAQDAALAGSNPQPSASLPKPRRSRHTKVYQSH
jgi:hypothetical protein